MQCKNHSDAAAVDRCAGCAESFCSDCLVQIHGHSYCGSCKTLALRGGLPVVDEATIPCKEASEALTFAFVSVFCFGFILGPVAVSKALKAKRIIELDPRLSGWGKANAAIIVGSAACLMNILFFITGAQSRR
jgi:hypothetical protein